MAYEHEPTFEYSDRSPLILHRHRCLGYRLGSINKRKSTIRLLGKLAKSMAQQSQRVMDYIHGLTKRKETTCGKNHDSPNRQPHCRRLHQTSRRHKILHTITHGNRNLKFSPDTQNHPSYEIPPGPIQWYSRRPIENESTSRVVPQTDHLTNDISENGHARNRSICIETHRCSTKICQRRPEGQRQRIHGRVQQAVELQSRMDISTTSPNSPRPPTSEFSSRLLLTSTAKVGESFLETRSEEASCVPADATNEPQSTPSRLTNKQSPSRHAEISFGGLEGTGWPQEINGWNNSEMIFLQSAWRMSTLKTYRSAWESWLQWSKHNNISSSGVHPNDLARYLIFLYETKKLALRTILVHKSTVATFSNPFSSESLSKHPLIQKTIKAISLKNPPKFKTTTWNVDLLRKHIAFKRIDEVNIFEVSQHVAMLLLLSTGRRIHDLTLLHINSKQCSITDTEIVFKPSFGSKSDNAKYRQPGWCLLKNEEPQFDLCHWIPILIKASESRRRANPDLTNLFITTRGKVKAASRTVIANWIKLAFKEAHISDSPGSFRSAVASDNWSKNDLDLDEVLRKGNWRSTNVFLKHYFREIRNENNDESHSVSNYFKTLQTVSLAFVIIIFSMIDDDLIDIKMFLINISLINKSITNFCLSR